MNTRQMTAADAIAESAARDRIVHIADHTTAQIELGNACEDWTDAGTDEDGCRVYEFWGTDADGDTWRVHLHGATGF